MLGDTAVTTPLAGSWPGPGTPCRFLYNSGVCIYIFFYNKENVGDCLKKKKCITLECETRLRGKRRKRTRTITQPVVAPLRDSLLTHVSGPGLCSQANQRPGPTLPVPTRRQQARHEATISGDLAVGVWVALLHGTSQAA